MTQYPSEHEQQFEALTQSLLCGFALVGVVRDAKDRVVDFRIVKVNPAFETLFGDTREALLGNSVKAVFKHLFGSALLPVLLDVVESGDPRQLEYTSQTLGRNFSIAFYRPQPEQVGAVIHDITAQTNTYEALKENERRYRQIFENSINGFALHEIILDDAGKTVDFRFLAVNEAFERHTGISPKNAIGKVATEVLPGIEKSDLLDVYGKVAQTGESAYLDIFYEPLNRYFIITAYCPEPGQFVTIFQDVTEQKLTEIAKKDSEEQFRTLYETMAQGVIYQDLDCAILSANPAAVQILGRSVPAMIGKTPADLGWQSIKLNGEPLAKEQHPAVMAMRTGEPVENYTYGIYNPRRKEYVWVDVGVIPQFRPGEEVPYQTFTTFLDVTDTIRVQKALEERIKELHCLTEVSGILQEERSLEGVCQKVVEELRQALQFPEKAVVRLTIGKQTFASAGDVPLRGGNAIFAPIQVLDEQFGRLEAYYRDDQPLLLPEETDLLSNVAERLALWYQQHHTQKLLEESEKKFRNAIMDAPNPVLIHAIDGEVIALNDAWTELTGFSREELPHVLDWLRLAHPEQYGHYSDADYPEILGYKGEFPVRTKTGETLHWFLNTAPLGNLPDGRLLLMSVAIDLTDRILAEQAKQHYYDRLNALWEIDQSIVSTLDLDQVLALITSHLSRVLSFDSMTILLIDGDDLKVIACQGFKNPDVIMNLRFPSKPEYPNFSVIENKAPATYLNVSEKFPLFHQPVEVGHNGEIKSWLGVPLVNQDQVIGMFTIDRVEERPFSVQDIEVAMQFANRAAIAITNARLFKQVTTQVERLEILRVIDGTITSEMRLEDSLKVICQQITQGLKVDIASVFLFDESRKALRFAQGFGLRTKGNPEIEVKIKQGYIGTVAQGQVPLFVSKVDLSDTGEQFPFSFKEEAVVSYYGLPLIAKGKLKGVLQIMHRQSLEPDEDWLEFAETLARQTAIAVDNLALLSTLESANQELRVAYDATIEGWAHALEIRDKETEGHSRRVARLTVDVAREFGFSEAELVHIRRGVLLHDIGKMGIPDNILHKPGPLDEGEWAVMQEHPYYAYEMLKDIDYLKPALKIPHFHHERWDGSGYPEGLKGEAIPLEARIFAVVDVWDALTSDRPYRNAWPPEKARQYLIDQSGIEFDPDVVEAFLKIMERA